jgi:hypothetical protein
VMCEFGTVGGYFMKISDCGKSACPDSKNYVPPTTNPTSPVTEVSNRPSSRVAPPTT